MEIMQAADGSHTLFVPEPDEHYHSVNGAVRESVHVFLRAGFDRIFRSMNEGGVIVTCCAKGAVRRMWPSAGFTMERLPGSPGKREMLRGTKKGFSREMPCK